jgi:peroxiredoxin
MNQITRFILLIILIMVNLWLPVNAQIPDKAEDISPLLYGESVPDVKITSIDGSRQSILSIIAEKPSVLIFYRGGWCPYCNTHLSELQIVEKDIIGLGYQIIAISPDSPENLQQTVDKSNLSYDLYSDSNGRLSEKMGLAFTAAERYSNMLNKRSDGLNSGFLPVPSVFVTDRTGKILFEYINPDYKTRLDPDLLLAVLNVLTNRK